MKEIDGSVYVHPSSVIMGAVKIGANSSVWPNAVMRGDFNPITVGEYTSIQDSVSVHSTPIHKVEIGNYVTVGHNAVIHACKIRDNVLVGMGATILDGAVIGENSVVGANALVRENTRVPPFSIVVGVPGTIKEGKPMLKESNISNAVSYYVLSRNYMEGKETISIQELSKALAEANKSRKA